MGAILRYVSKFSLKTQWLAVLAGLWSLSLLLSLWLSLALERAALEQIDSSIRGLSQTIQVSFQHLSSPGSFSPVNLVDLRTRMAPQVAHIVLRGPDGAVLASVPEGEPITTSGAGTVRIPFAVQGEPLGTIEVGMNLESVSGTSSALFLRHAGFSLLLLALGLVVALPLSARLAGPIAGLTSVAGKVAGGDLRVSLPDPSSQEMQGLLSSFSEMLAKLRGQRKLEAELAASEREAAVGRMAAGIAHDIRTPLNFISLALGQIKAQADSGAPLGGETSGLIEETLLEVSRIKEITQDLNDFSRSGVVHETRLENASQILEEALEDVRRRHPEQAGRLSTDGFDRHLRVQVNGALLGRSLVNLLENALEADPKSRVACSLQYQDGQVVFRVEDNGPGIPEKRMAKIFLPYYTTKSAGIGLGLALASKWAAEMGGRASASNRSSEGGAVFELSFPARKAEEQPA